MKRYDSYKDSGAEWLGEIPENWQSYRIDWISKIVRGNTGFKRDELLESGEYIALQYGKTYKVDIVDDNFSFYVNNEFYKESQIVSRGDTILISTSETIEDLGHICFYDNKKTGLIGGEQILLKPNRKLLFDKYLYRYAQCFSIESKKYAKGLKVFRFNTNDLKRIFIAIPSIEEQTQIANYLDHKTTQINDLISKKEKLIKLLKEERIAIINQAVTKGLDPNVRMKDSGIEWLGEIPEHWDVAKFNLFVTIRHGHQFMSYDFTDEGIRIIKITQLHRDGYLDLSKCSYVSREQLETYQSILIKEKDILMCLTGGTIGKIIRVGEVIEPLLQNYRVGHFSSAMPNRITDDFIFWVMSSESLISQIFFQMRETGQPNIGMEDFGRMRITIPSIEEQNSIVRYLEGNTTRIDNLQNKLFKEIELLKEYKTALISEVVTGKVDVRDEKIN